MAGTGDRGAASLRAASLARGRAQHGVTMIEVLVAVALLSGVFMALVAGMLTTAKVSGAVTRSTTTSAALNGVTERIKSMTYIPCDGHGAPTPADLTATYTGWSDRYVPRGVTVEVVSVNYWNATSFGASCVIDGGAQLLGVRVSAPGGAAATAQVVVRDPQARPR